MIKLAHALCGLGKRCHRLDDVKVGQDEIGTYQEPGAECVWCFDPAHAIAEASEPSKEFVIVDKTGVARHHRFQRGLRQQSFCGIVLLSHLRQGKPKRLRNLLQ